MEFSACPTNCAECADSGSGTGVCKKCVSGYNLLEDPADASRDNTKCLKCPTECSTCSGVENGALATCTACKADLGLWVDGSDCLYCDSDVNKEACKNCDEGGACSECNEGWRLDQGTCVACPNFCLTCSVDESTASNICETCEAGFGEKPADSNTCDACPLNCAACVMSGAGILSCATCKSGYAMNGDGKCVACASGCATCHWVTADSYMSCDTCLEGKTTSPITPDGNAESATNIGVCLSCPSHCSTCPDADNCQNTAACDEGYVIVADANTHDKCEPVTANCATPADDGSTDCTTCNDGYYQVGGACTSCPAGHNCKTCDATVCLTCPDNYAFVDSTDDSTQDSCEPCGINKCLTCHAIADDAGNPKKCTVCDTGYVLYNADGDASNGNELCKSKCFTHMQYIFDDISYSYLFSFICLIYHKVAYALLHFRMPNWM